MRKKESKTFAAFAGGKEGNWVFLAHPKCYRFSCLGVMSLLGGETKLISKVFFS